MALIEKLLVSEIAWLWTRTWLMGTIQKPRPHWTSDLILGQKPNAIFDPQMSLIQLCPDWQRISTWKCMMHFPTHFFKRRVLVSKSITYSMNLRFARSHRAKQLTYDKDCTYTWTVLLPCTVVRTVDVSCTGNATHDVLKTTTFDESGAYFAFLYRATVFWSNGASM